MGETVLTIRDVADRLGKDEKTVRRLIKNGELPAYRHRISRTYGLDEADVEEFEAKQWLRVEPLEEEPAAA